MLTIIIQVNVPSGNALGIKEDLAMHLEKFGDTKIISINETTTKPEQCRIGGM